MVRARCVLCDSFLLPGYLLDLPAEELSGARNTLLGRKHLSSKSPIEASRVSSILKHLHLAVAVTLLVGTQETHVDSAKNREMSWKKCHYEKR